MAQMIGQRVAFADCRIGERSAHSWFALKYLLGYPDVRHYDGSWTEWAAPSAYRSRERFPDKLHDTFMMPIGALANHRPAAIFNHIWCRR